MHTVNIKKHEHLADLRDTAIFLADTPTNVFSNSDPINMFQFQDLSIKRDNSDEFLEQISVDPDNMLSKQERNEFHQLNAKYKHLFTPQPRKYNGAIGYIDNKIQFSTPPAPNARTHVPNYSPSMNQLQATKMDQLEDWGILVPPEKVGIAAAFVSPSMFVPKVDSDEFILATDSAALNLYIKRVPNTSATIAQAKARIARANFVIHLD